jgi:hypothetical protein
MRATFLRIWTLFCCLSLPALGNPSTNDPAQAEMMRLTQDLSNLAKRQHWQGVERIYERILAIPEATPHYEVHRLAADASKAKGDMAATLDRLERATALDPREEDLQFMDSLRENYGYVVLETTPRRPVTLSVDRMPFPPDQRLQIKAAMVACDKEGHFDGMLPIGMYRLENKIFEVTRGLTIQVELAEAN